MNFSFSRQNYCEQNKPLRKVYLYAVSRTIVEKIIELLNFNVEITKNVDDADIVLAHKNFAKGGAKVLNTAKAKVEDVLKNEELVSLINAIGAGFGADFDISKSNYRRIIIMTDADTDGAHIQTLLLTFFFRYMRELIEEGYLFIATPPLYKLSYKNEHEYAWTDEELREKVNKLKNVQIQRYKGLGEMNATQLKETTMDPANRTLIQVEISEESSAENKMNILMGDDVEPRREWIESNVSFDFDDNFSLEDVEQDE